MCVMYPLEYWVERFAFPYYLTEAWATCTSAKCRNSARIWLHDVALLPGCDESALIQPPPVWPGDATGVISSSAAAGKLEGNVLRNLRPAMFQMLMGKDIQISMICNYSWYPNIHDIQISMISKYPWYPNIHDVQMSMMSTSQNYGHTCHMWSHL